MHEELKKLFDDNFDCYCNVEPTGGDPAITKEKFVEIVSVFIESKLPKEVEIKLVEEQTYYRCPNCGIWLSNADGSDEEDDYTDNYCPNCGSKINWK